MGVWSGAIGRLRLPEPRGPELVSSGYPHHFAGSRGRAGGPTEAGLESMALLLTCFSPIGR